MSLKRYFSSYLLKLITFARLCGQRRSKSRETNTIIIVNNRRYITHCTQTIIQWYSVDLHLLCAQNNEVYWNFNSTSVGEIKSVNNRITYLKKLCFTFARLWIFFRSRFKEHFEIKNTLYLSSDFWWTNYTVAKQNQHLLCVKKYSTTLLAVIRGIRIYVNKYFKNYTRLGLRNYRIFFLQNFVAFPTIK